MPGSALHLSWLDDDALAGATKAWLETQGMKSLDDLPYLGGAGDEPAVEKEKPKP